MDDKTLWWTRVEWPVSAEPQCEQGASCYCGLTQLPPVSWSTYPQHGAQEDARQSAGLHGQRLTPVRFGPQGVPVGRGLLQDVSVMTQQGPALVVSEKLKGV